jgi:AcrR family transcriptional regulator
VVVDDIEVARRAPAGGNPMVGPKGTRTQRRILTGALAAFAARGYHDTRIEQITEAAGCSRSTFYQYFSGKEAVFGALAAHVDREVAEIVGHLRPVGADAAGRDAVTALMRELADLYDTYGPVFAGLSAAARDDADLPGGASAIGGLGAALRPHLRLPSAPAGDDPDRREPGTAGRIPDHDVLASVVVTLVLRANLLRLGTRGLVARDRFVESLAGVVHRALVGPVPGLDGAARADAGGPARRARRRAPQLDPGPSAVPAPSAQGRQTQARIVAAGIEVFPKLGVHATRVDDVVEVAGVSHGSFYRYFDGRDDLFRVIAVAAAAELVGCIDRLPVGDDPTALRAWLSDWFRVYAEHGGIIALWRETQFPDPSLAVVTHQVADHAVGHLLDVLGERAVGDPLVDAMAVLGLLETVPHQVHAAGHHREADAVDALVVTIRRGVLGLPDGTSGDPGRVGRRGRTA